MNTLLTVQMQRLANQMGDSIIPYFENPQLQINEHKHYFKRIYRNKIKIIDANDQVLMDTFKQGKHASNSAEGDDLRKHHKPPIKSFDYISDSGKHYQIFLQPQSKKIIFQEVIAPILALRLLVFLFFSGLFSYLLTLFIAKPLKQLGSENRLFSSSDFNQADSSGHNTIDSALLRRKDEIGGLARDLRKMQINISTLINSKQDLLHDVSHELRAPLARLMATNGLIQQKIGEDNPLFLRLDKECLTMSHLIEQILYLSRVAHYGVQAQPFDLHEMLIHCLDDMAFEFPAASINIQVSSELTQVHSDCGLLQTAIMNILRNACQHSGSMPKIDISVRIDSLHYLIEINDHGNGVPPQQLETLFKPFYRDRHSSGFGLGLNIASRAVQNLSGSIAAFNRAEGGLSVQINLPTTKAG